MLRFRLWCVRGEKQNELLLALKQGNVATFGATLQRELKPTSRRSWQRRDVTESGTKRRRDVEDQRRDVPETHKNSRCDVDYSRRDVPEGIKINVATLRSNVATLQRRLPIRILHIKQPRSARTSPLVNVILWTCNALQKLILPSTFVFET